MFLSRPFSYNDKNFTVIGNILFVHCVCNGAVENGGVICDVPPQIAARMATNNNFAVLSNTNSKSGPVTINIVLNSSNQFVARSAIDSTIYTDRLLYAIYLLKDL